MRKDRITILATVAGTLMLTAGLIAIEPIRDATAAGLNGDLEQMRADLKSLGAWAALVLIGVGLVHVVVPFPSEIPNAAAGFVFGFAVGVPLMVLAWTISCLVAYGIARAAGEPALHRLAGAERMAKAEHFVARGGWTMLVAARLIPIVPLTVASLAAGATRVPLARFTWTTAVGVIPLIALAALLGSRLQEFRLDDPVLWAVAGATLLLLALAHPVSRRLRSTP